MRTAAKVMLAIGGVLTVIGIIVTLIGGTSLAEPFRTEDWSGELKWEGTTPTTYTGEFDWNHMYNVWVEDGSSVQVEIISGDYDNRFISCEELDNCWMFDEEGAISGYEYIGEIFVMDSGTWQVQFTDENGGNVDVMIRDDDSFSGFLGIFGGSAVCCTGILFLITGGIMAATMKDKQKVEMSTIVPFGTEDVVVVHDSPATELVEPVSADGDSSPESDGEWWNESDNGENT